MSEATTQSPPRSPPADPVFDSETDSAYGDGPASSTTSITSSIMEYRELHGRTFHGYQNTEYWGPNDEKQNEQLDIGHHMLTLLLDNKLFLAPIKSKPQKVLDVGTGTGIWAIDFADLYPSAEVVGTDISPIQPVFVPPNLKFEIDDAQLDWTYPENEFDFVHLRCLMGSIADWPRLFEQAFRIGLMYERCTAPGGYIESVEMDIQFKSDDGSVVPGTTMYDWSQLFINAGEAMGRTFLIARDSKRLIQEAGYRDVIEQKYKVPVGNWMEDRFWSDLGRWNLVYLLTGLEGMALYILTNVLKWDYPAVQAYVGKMRQSLKSKSNRGYYEITVVYGHKPG